METLNVLCRVPTTLVAGFLLFIVAGCEQPDAGINGGIGDVHRHDTIAERRDGKIDSGKAIEASDTAVDDIIEQIATAPEMKQLGNRKAVFVLGKFRNQTNTPDVDFERLMLRIRSKLVSSPFARKQLRIINDPKVVQRMQEHMSGPRKPDLLQDALGEPKSDQFDPNFIFFMNAELLESVRGGKHIFQIQFDLTNLVDGTIVVSSLVEFTQI